MSLKKDRDWDISISVNDKSELLGDILINISPNSWSFLFVFNLLLLYTIIKLSGMERKPPTPAGNRGKAETPQA